MLKVLTFSENLSEKQSLVIRLFEIPESLEAALEIYMSDAEENESDPLTEEGAALQIILNAPFAQIMPYRNYIADKAEFGTHQGVKGREFPHVMAITDDLEARGFMFKYAKMFGDAELSDTDKKNLEDGKDNAVHRALRLLYVYAVEPRKVWHLLFIPTMSTLLTNS